jgi:hypothetical protein
MSDQKDKPEPEGKPDDPEDLDLDGIDRFLKNGLDAIPVEKVARDSLQAQVVAPLDLGQTGPQAPGDKSARKEPTPKQAAEFDPGLETLVLREGFGDLEKRISPDRMLASVAVFEPRRAAVSVEEVVAVLEANHIVFGIDERIIRSMLSKTVSPTCTWCGFTFPAAKRGRVALNVIFARGIPVVEGQDARFLLPCLDDRPEETGSAPELTDEVLKEMDRVRKALRDGPDYLKEESLRAVWLMKMRPRSSSPW